MSTRKPGTININRLAKIGRDAYSRPVGLVQQMCLEIICFYSKRGTTNIDEVERVTSSYAKIYPDSIECISMFLVQAYNIARK